MSPRNIKKTMAGMSWKDKLEYLWTYYKWVLAVAAGVILLICIVVSSIMNKSVTTLYGGTIINAELSEEGEAYLTDDWFEHLGGVDKKEKVELTTSYYNDLSTTQDPEADAAAAMRVTAMVAAKELDYVIMDELSFNYYKKATIFSSLEEVLSQELIDELNDRIVYYTDEEEGVTYPIALDITDTTFVQDCIHGSKTLYIAFPGNTDRTERNDQFLEYLLNWK